ncbi:hypothetical protein M0805_001814 [Coniferiporia weirii]|nr:hypothetical protein M0805_001814 [Coniferiporia weirii]
MPPLAPRAKQAAPPSAANANASATAKARAACRKPATAATRVAHGRARRPGWVIETDPARYDRRDPFAAFTALRRLLVALPASQFRMSPDEQKLAVHLLGVVEPFIGPTPSPARRTLTRQPVEILDQIAAHVPGPRDLLALALTCRRMHDVVCPRHLDYRVVRCKLSRLAVWAHLASSRALAAHVRRLEVLDERALPGRERVPGEVRAASDTEVEESGDELAVHERQGRLLVAALSRMVGLEVFVWSCNHSPVSLYSIWPTLLKCQTLKSVEINDNQVFGPAPESEEDTPSTSRRRAILPRLSSVAVRSFKKGFGQNKTLELTRVTDMLHHCPNLEELDIQYNGQTGPGSPQADDFFLYGRWPGLRTLALTHLSCSIDGADAVSTFLSAHPNIEVLHLDVGPRASVTATAAALALAPPGTLPRLRELRCAKELACAIMACPCPSAGDGTGNARPLEAVKGVALTGGVRDQPFFEALRGYAIRRVELAGYGEFEDVKRLVACVPRVAWLDVGKKGCGGGVGATGMGTAAGMGAGQGHKGPVAISSVVDWADLLTQLPELAVFHGVRFFYEVSDTAAPSSSSSFATSSSNFASSSSGPTPSSTPSLASSSTSGMSMSMSMSDRSRVRKNDEVASVLAWKCPGLRRLDHWDEHAGKVVVLVKDAERGGEKVRWEVRRVKT